MNKSVIANKTYLFLNNVLWSTFVQAEFKHSQTITYAIEEEYIVLSS